MNLLHLFRSLSMLAQIGTVLAIALSLFAAWQALKWSWISEGRERERAAIQRQNDAANRRGERWMNDIDTCYEKGRQWDAINFRCLD